MKQNIQIVAILMSVLAMSCSSNETSSQRNTGEQKTPEYDGQKNDHTVDDTDHENKAGDKTDESNATTLSNESKLVNGFWREINDRQDVGAL